MRHLKQYLSMDVTVVLCKELLDEPFFWVGHRLPGRCEIGYGS